MEFHKLPIAEVERLTPKSVSLAFDIPEELKQTFRFVPGQFLTLRADIDGQDERRSYSICSAMDEPYLKVGIKQLAGGVFSTFANEKLRPGMELLIAAPDGRFQVRPDHDAAKTYIAFAAGSGITPILSIVKSILAREPKSSLKLFYGNQSGQTIMFREELEELKDKYLTRFELLHLLSREPQDVDILAGRLDAAKLAALIEAGLIDSQNTDMFLLCGPGDMTMALKQALLDHGVSSDRIRHELFTPLGEIAPNPPPPKPPESMRDGIHIEAIIDGVHQTFDMNADDTGVLDAARNAGIELPFSCRNGMCCTCRCRLVSGEAGMALNYSLEPWEMEQGFVLACQLQPASSSLVLDFDAI